MSIIYFEGIKPPCNPTESQHIVLRGEKEMGDINNNGLRLSH